MCKVYNVDVYTPLGIKNQSFKQCFLMRFYFLYRVNHIGEWDLETIVRNIYIFMIPWNCTLVYIFAKSLIKPFKEFIQDKY